MENAIMQVTLAKRHAASVERALSLTRSEDSPVVDLLADTGGRSATPSSPQRSPTLLARPINQENAPPLI